MIQEHYGAPVSRRGIFNYVYGLLHHPGYRSRYAANLKRDLPRIPLVGNLDTFRAMAAGGKKLIGLHINYEGKKEYRLKRRENPDVKLDWRVEVMRLSRDGKAIYYNDFLTLTGVPPEVFDYRLGNRSALEWVIDQYRVTREDEGEIVKDPNRNDDEQYIVRLLGQVVTVSLETLKICAALPEIEFD